MANEGNLVKKGDVFPLVEIRAPSEDGALSTMSPQKRAWYISEITEAFAVSLVRDVRSFAESRAIPAAVTKRRQLWEATRRAMMDSFVKLFQLDREHVANGSWKDAKSLVIDVPTNVKQVSEPQKPVA